MESCLGISDVHCVGSGPTGLPRYWPRWQSNDPVETEDATAVIQSLFVFNSDCFQRDGLRFPVFEDRGEKPPLRCSKVLTERRLCDTG
jgi:hypothetical protein